MGTIDQEVDNQISLQSKSNRNYYPQSFQTGVSPARSQHRCAVKRGVPSRIGSNPDSLLATLGYTRSQPIAESDPMTESRKASGVQESSLNCTMMLVSMQRRLTRQRRSRHPTRCLLKCLLITQFIYVLVTLRSKLASILTPIASLTMFANPLYHRNGHILFWLGTWIKIATKSYMDMQRLARFDDGGLEAFQDAPS